MAEEDKKLVEYLKALGVPPMKDLDDFKRFMTDYGKTTVDPEADPVLPDTKTTVKVKGQVHVPRISIFFGEEGKGEVTYQTWAYEVKCLVAEKTYTDEILLQAIRRSLKGHAADQLRYLGVKPTLHGIMENFQSTYGMVETSEFILKKFYVCRQNPSESVVKYCARLEDIHAQALEMKALETTDDMLRRVFYRGLSPHLKHLSAFKFETCKGYKEFKIEVRTIESELEEEKDREDSEEIQAKCHVIYRKDDKKEKTKTEQQLNELTSLMKTLNTRLENLEKKREEKTSCQQQQIPEQTEVPQPIYQQQVPFNHQQQQRRATPPQQQMPFQNQQQQRAYNTVDPQPNYPQQNYSYRPFGFRGPKHFRGPRGSRPRGTGPFRGNGRGSNTYRTQRPVASQMFQPVECYACHERGHFARNCPLNF